MAQISFPGIGGPLSWLPFISVGVTETSMLIDAAGEKAAFIGRVWTPNRGAKSIRKVGFKFGTVTKAAGSTLTVSLQDVSLTSGPPGQPDETQDQTYAVANADAGFASNAWYQTGALSADRAVNHGDLLGVVIEFNSFVATDAVNINGMISVSTPAFAGGAAVLKTASWANQGIVPNVILEFSDGTFGTLMGAMPYKTLTNQAFNVGSAGADEYGIQWTPPVPVMVEGAWFLAQANANADFEVDLYDGTTALVTVTVDYNTVNAAATYRYYFVSFSPQWLYPNKTYYLSLRPTTANSVTIPVYSLNAAGHLQALSGGDQCILAKRLDQGAWSTVNTDRPAMGFMLAGIDSPPIVHPGMAGGMRG